MWKCCAPPRTLALSNVTGIEQAQRFAMSLATMITEWKAAIMATIKHKTDLKLPDAGNARTNTNIGAARRHKMLREARQY